MPKDPEITPHVAAGAMPEPAARPAPSPLELRRVRASELNAVFELLAANGWGHRLGDAARFAALVEASQIATVALVEQQLVGFVRAITDGLSNGYLSMLVVAPAHRGRGIGRRLVQSVLDGGPGITWVLRAGREGAPAFFARLGFEPSALAMERRRD